MFAFGANSQHLRKYLSQCFESGILSFQCGDFRLCFRDSSLRFRATLFNSLLVAIGDAILVDDFLVGHLVKFRQYVQNCLLSTLAEIPAQQI